MKRFFSDKIKSMSGMCSTFLPGKQGEDGDRAPVTFVGSSEYTTFETSTISFTIPGDGSAKTIANTLGISIAPYDYIIYAMNGHTYLLNVTSVIVIAGSNTTVSVEIIDSWDTTASDPSDPNDINVTIGCVKRALNRMYMPKGVTTNPTVTNGFIVTGPVDRILSNSINYGFQFNVTATTAATLGNFRIQIEFNTSQSSPAMDTMIAKMFTDPSTNISVQINEENTQGDRGTPSEYTREKLTFRGYMGNYSCIRPTGTYNFDNEKLDDFTVIIKDYNEGVGSKNFSKNICIPQSVFKQADENGHRYTCKVYGYVNEHGNIYQKVYIWDITDALYNMINGEGTSGGGSDPSDI